MSDWSEEAAKAKAERRTPAPDRVPPNLQPASKKGKKAKVKGKYWVMRRNWVAGQKDMVFTKFHTMEEAEAYIAKLSRGAHVSGLHYPAGTPVDNRVLIEEQERWKAKFYVKVVE